MYIDSFYRKTRTGKQKSSLNGCNGIILTIKVNSDTDNFSFKEKGF